MIITLIGFRAYDLSIEGNENTSQISRWFWSRKRFRDINDKKVKRDIVYTTSLAQTRDKTAVIFPNF